MDKVLKVSYGLNLSFKSLKGVVTETDFSLNISERESIELLNNIRKVIRGENSYHEVKYSNIELMITYEKGALEISLTEYKGEMSKPLNKYSYNTYLGGQTLLDGLRNEVIKIEDL